MHSRAGGASAGALLDRPRAWVLSPIARPRTLAISARRPDFLRELCGFRALRCPRQKIRDVMIIVSAQRLYSTIHHRAAAARHSPLATRRSQYTVRDSVLSRTHTVTQRPFDPRGACSPRRQYPPCPGRASQSCLYRSSCLCRLTPVVIAQ